MTSFLEIILHVDTFLQSIVSEYALLAYAILFLIIFCETGLVFTPFLPGDSLLFMAGALCATGSLEIEYLLPLLTFAAVLGDTANYHIGKYIGPKIFKKESSLFFNSQHLIRAQEFYKKYGKKTIILARFVPIIRTFAPFVAGIGKMEYSTFLSFNVIGGIAWCGICLFAGFFFGNIPFVQENFSAVILGIIFLSILPIIIEVIMEQRKQKNTLPRQ